MSGRGIVNSAREVFLTLGALLGVACILVTAAGFAFGIMPLVFRSGSMSPAIHTGDLGVARTVDADELKVGDIVSVVNADGHRVTHRVRNVATQGDARQLTLQGDANETPDAEVYTVTHADHVLFHIPRAGYVVDAAAGPAGLFVLGAYVTGMLVLAFRRRPPDEKDVPPRPRRGGERKARRSKRSAARSVTVVMVGATVMVASPAVAGAWTNDVPVTGSTFAAYTVPAPATFACGTLGVNSVTFNWAAVAGATNYTVHYGAGGALTRPATGTSVTINAAITSGTAWVEANRSFGFVTWSSGPSNTRTYTVAGVSLCS